jgi:hypothetical protein
VDVGQSEVASTVTVSQSFVIDSEQVEQSRMQIMHMDFVLSGVKPKIIGCTITESGLDSRAAHPPSESVGIVVSTVISLGRGSSSELSTPYQQGVFEETASVHVFD